MSQYHYSFYTNEYCNSIQIKRKRLELLTHAAFFSQLWHSVLPDTTQHNTTSCMFTDLICMWSHSHTHPDFRYKRIATNFITNHYNMTFWKSLRLTIWFVMNILLSIEDIMSEIHFKDISQLRRPLCANVFFCDQNFHSILSLGGLVFFYLACCYLALFSSHLSLF